MAKFSPETKEAKRQWDETFKMLRENGKPRMEYPAKLSFKNVREKKIFLDTQKLHLLPGKLL